MKNLFLIWVWVRWFLFIWLGFILFDLVLDLLVGNELSALVTENAPFQIFIWIVLIVGWYRHTVKFFKQS
jgi:hypothetical protein